MQKIKDIINFDNGELVEEFIGRVVKVWPPKEPTAGQARAGIHQQALECQDSLGNPLRVVIMNVEQHIPSSDAGCLFHFKSTEDDRGKLGGISVNVWTPEGKSPQVSVQLSGQAHFYKIAEDDIPNATGKQHPASVTRSQEAKEKAPVSKPQSQGFAPSIQDHVEFYSSIVEGLEIRLKDSALFDSFLKDPQPLMGAATSIFIQSCQNGTFNRFVTQVPESKAEWPDVIGSGGNAPAITIENERKVAENSQVIARMLMNGKVKEGRGFSKINHHSPDMVFDNLIEIFEARGKSFDDVNDAFESLRTALGKGGKKASADDVHKAVIDDFETFLSFVGELEPPKTSEPITAEMVAEKFRATVKEQSAPVVEVESAVVEVDDSNPFKTEPEEFLA